MMKNIKIILFLIALTLIGVFLYYHNNSYKSNQYSQDYSIKGCYVSKIGNDVYTLTILSDSPDSISGTLSFKNFEKDSSSGSFTGSFKDDILLGDYSFDSEGMHSVRQVIFKKSGSDFIEGFGDVKTIADKETFSDLNSITFDPKLTFLRSPRCSNSVNSYTEPNGVFNMNYNSQFVALNGNNEPTKDWKVNGDTEGVILAKIIIPKSYMPNTNFSSANLNIGRSNDPTAIKNCLIEQGIDKKSTTSIAINGVNFTRMSYSEGAAGNFYNTTMYRSILDGDCYAIEYTIHSTNIANYPSDSGIKEFDNSGIKNELENIVKSFRFLLNSN